MAFVRTTAAPEVLGGVPCVRGLRLPVATVVGMVADEVATVDILADFPYLKAEGSAAVQCYAAAAGSERLLPLRPVG